MFATSIHYHSSLIFVDKAGAYHSRALTGLHCNGRLITLPASIWQVWKWMEMAYPHSYYNMATITVVKSFTVQAPDASK